MAGGEGWFLLDPAGVREVMPDEKRDPDDEAVCALRERPFGAWEMSRVGFNSATDIELPGAGGQKPNVAFLMYPCAFTETGQPDCLNPAGFRHEIAARESAV